MRRYPAFRKGGNLYWNAATGEECLEKLINSHVVAAVRRCIEEMDLSMPYDFFPRNGNELSTSPLHKKMPADPLTVRIRGFDSEWYRDFSFRSELMQSFRECASDGSYLLGCELMHAELSKLTARLGRLLKQGRKAAAEREAE